MYVCVYACVFYVSTLPLIPTTMYNTHIHPTQP